MTDFFKCSSKGLTTEQVEQSRLKYGTNKMTKKKRKSIFKSFLENLCDPVIKVLIISLVVNILFTLHNIDWLETGGILVAILLAFFLGGFGIHNFYLGETKKGILKICTCWIGVGGILALIDFIKMLIGSYVVDPDKLI